jgi:hypothetical protein
MRPAAIILTINQFELTNFYKDIDVKEHFKNFSTVARRQFFRLKISLCGPHVGLSFTYLP